MFLLLLGPNPLLYICNPIFLKYTEKNGVENASALHKLLQGSSK